MYYNVFLAGHLHIRISDLRSFVEPPGHLFLGRLGTSVAHLRVQPAIRNTEKYKFPGSAANVP